MNNISIWDHFTKQYKLSKTLRFELRPVGKTAEWIEKKGIIKANWQNGENKVTGEDAKKAEHYKQVKGMMNQLHLLFIEDALSIDSVRVYEKTILRENKKKKNEKKNQKKPTIKDLLSLHYENWINYFGAKTEENKNSLNDSKKKLYKVIETILTEAGDRWKKNTLGYYKEKEKRSTPSKGEKIPKIKAKGSQIFFGNTEDPFVLLQYQLELGRIHLLKNEKNKEDYTQKELLEFVETFKGFHSYFSGFNENRANIYNTKDEISTSIAYRLFDQNIEFFFHNIRNWQRFQKSLTDTEITEQLESKKWNLPALLIELEETILKPRFGYDLNSFFSPETYFLLFSQSGIDAYNEVLGGLAAETGQKKVQGLNEIINLTRQQASGDKKAFPVLHLLYKQILSDRKKTFIEKFESPRELLVEVKEFADWSLLKKKRPNQGKKDEDTFTYLERIFDELSQDLKKHPAEKKEFYLGKKAIEKLSTEINEGYNAIHNLWRGKVDSMRREDGRPLTKAQKNSLQNQKYLSFAEIEDLIYEHVKQNGNFLKDSWQGKLTQNFSITDYMLEKLKIQIEIGEENQSTQVAGSETPSIMQSLKSSDLQAALKNLTFGENRDNTIAALKNYLEACLSLFHFVKDFQVQLSDLKEDQYPETSSDFQNLIRFWLEDDFDVIPLYNKVRNFVTQKSYSTEKIKLNFERPTFLNGWDQNKERANLGILFRKDNFFYLGIIDKEDTAVLDYHDDDEIKKEIFAKENEDKFEKINYKLLPGANKMLPKVFFSEKNISFYNPSQKIMDIRNHSSHTKSGEPHAGFEKKNLNMNHCYAMIDFFKESIARHPDWKNFGFQFSETIKYNDISDFYREVESQGYNISYDSIKADYIHRLVEEGKLYLFKIYNKDFAAHAKGKENLHTSYWKLLFAKENLDEVVLKLNGEAEVFFRPASIAKDKAIIHKKHQKLVNKNPNNLKRYSLFEYDLIKDKRFTENKFQFHCPITLNFKAEGQPYLNNQINKFLAQNRNVNIIGIDRGEKHLLYYSVIRQNGDIIEQGSLNTISSAYTDTNNKKITVETPYHSILDQKEKERDKARKSWQSIEKIKDFKEGYLSYVVHKLALLIIKHNAIVVLEDLNMGFKRGRFKVEKQVYQKFEKSLIEKLNYLVFKDRNFGEAGHYLSAYQLTNKFDSFQKLGKQSGILFYTAASYTSKVDPVSGYMQNLYHNYSQGKTREFFQRFKSITFNGEYFNFNYNLNDLLQTEDEQIVKTEWTLVSCVSRSVYDSRAKKSDIINVNAKLKELFVSANVDLTKEKDLKATINKQDENFMKKLHYYFMLIQNMRVTDPGGAKGTDENDYILSPVAPFYNSLQVQRKQIHEGSGEYLLPNNGDANGAYNIARKGIIILHKINLRKQLEIIYLEEKQKLEWEKPRLEKSILKIKDRDLLLTLFEDWCIETGRVSPSPEDFITEKSTDNFILNNKGKEFVAYLSTLAISKSDWQNYSQSEKIVRHQIELWKESAT